MTPFILVSNDPSTPVDPTRFDPAAVPGDLHIVPYDVDEHWPRIGYFLMLDDGRLIIDGVGIKSHLVLAKTYWFLRCARQWDEALFTAFNATVKFGGIWPPILILMSSRAYPGVVPADELRDIIRRFAPGGDLAFRTDAIYFDFGKLTERVEAEVRRVATEAAPAPQG